MSLTLDAATARLAREMSASETAIDDALVSATSLMHSAALAQREFAHLAPAVRSQSTMLHLSKLMSGLIEARGEALRVHGQLLDIGREMGATESPYCPPKNEIDTNPRKAA